MPVRSELEMPDGGYVYLYSQAEYDALATELAGEQKKFRRTIAMLVIAAGGSIRVSMLDYLKAEEAGVIQSWTDHKTNDQVYTVGVTAPETRDDYPPTQAAVIRDNGDPR